MRFSEQSDEDLLKDAAAGHFTAFEELLQRHQQRLLNFYWRMTGSLSEAQALFEETWGELYKLRNSNAALSQVSIALFGIATRKAIRVAMENPPRDEKKGAPALRGGASQLAVQDAILSAGLLALPLKERAAVLLSYFDSLGGPAMSACINERQDTAQALAEAGLHKLLLALGPDFAKNDALKALALEASPAVPPRLLRRSLQAVRRLEVSQQLSLQAGEDTARQILLNRQPSKNQSWAPALYALLALLAALGFFYFGPQKLAPQSPAPQRPESTPVPSVPTTIQEGAAATTPHLSDHEKAEENALDAKARRMLISQLSHEKHAPLRAPRPVRATPTAGIEPPSLSLSQTRLSLSQHGTINFYMALPEKGQIELRIFDSAGRTVRLLADGPYGPGDLNLSFDGKNDLASGLPPGVYYARAMTRWFSRVEALELQP